MTVFDIHTHGVGGVDTRTTDPADILKMAEIHGRHGVDAILATIYPAPLETMRANMTAVRGAMGFQSRELRVRSSERPDNRGEKFGDGTPACGSPELGVTKGGEEAEIEGDGDTVRVATILGVYLEGPFLNPLRAGALDSSSFRAPSAYDLDRLLDGFEDIVRIVTIAPEPPGALALIRPLADRGMRVSMGHSDATFAEAEAGFHAGASGVTHLFNAMRPWHHREPGLAGFALTHPDLYVEVIADPHHLHRGALNLVFKVKDPGRIILVSDSIGDTGQYGSGEALADPSGRLHGGALTVTAAAGRLTDLGYPVRTVDAAITVNPAAYITR
jgi:N-acetylglucosamine-6-phosphate deacetylase